MIAKLTGLVDDVSTDTLILDVQGVGYLVHASARTLAALPNQGERTTLHIHYFLRQEQPCLAGFASVEERDCFCILTTVQGVGTRVALAILSTFSPGDLARIVSAQDKTAMTRAEGVGPKLAARMLTELKDKLTGFFANSPSAGTVLSVPAFSKKSVEAEDDSPLSQAISALTNLGYKKTDVMDVMSRALEQVGIGAPLDELVRYGLSHLSRVKVS